MAERPNGQQENELIETVTDTLPPGTVVLSGQSTQCIQTTEVGEDILQQALEEASESFGEAVVQFSETGPGPGHDTPQDCQEVVEFNCVDADGAEVSPGKIVGCLPPGVQLIANSDGTHSLQNGFGDETLQVVSSVPGPSEENHVYVNGDDASASAGAPSLEGTAPATETPMESHSLTQTQNAGTQNIQASEQGDSAGQSGSINLTVLPSNQSGAPLGSSLNPIRIIQQGNQYTPIQHLTTEQLQQIMQVVQQQQVAKSAQQVGGTSILFNPQTNTRIVYRVIYPSELHKNAQEAVMTITSKSVETSSHAQQTVLPQKRPYRKRNREEEDKMDLPELSKEEREERKKIKTKTRSGRVSKPPKHMVKDYKHIHVLDWDEEPYDDSDGGYSDFKCSDEEREEKHAEKRSADTPLDLLNSTRPKNWKCESCGKAYIGRAGLGRHYKLYPDHGHLEDEPEGILNEKGINSWNGLNSADNFSEDSNTQDSFTTSTPTPVQPLDKRPPRKYGRYNIVDPVKRKARIKELLRRCDDDEVKEIVLPRLSRALTLWEFFLTKVEKGKPPRVNAGDIYQEFALLHKKVKTMCQEYFVPLSEVDCDKNLVDDKNVLQVDNAVVAESLGLNCGKYQVKEIKLQKPPEKPAPVNMANLSFKNMHPVSNQSAISVISKSDLNKQQKSNIKVISKSNLVQQQTRYIIKSPISSKNNIISSQPTSGVKSLLTPGKSIIKVAPQNIAHVVSSSVPISQTSLVMNGHSKLKSSANTKSVHNESSIASQASSTSYLINSQGKFAKKETLTPGATTVKSSSLPPYIQTVVVPQVSASTNTAGSVGQSVIIPQVATGTVNSSSVGQTVLIPQVSGSNNFTSAGQTVIVQQASDMNVSGPSGQAIFVPQVSGHATSSSAVAQTILIPQSAGNSLNSSAIGQTILIPQTSLNSTNNSGTFEQTILIPPATANANNLSAVGQNVIPEVSKSSVNSTVVNASSATNGNLEDNKQTVLIPAATVNGVQTGTVSSGHSTSLNTIYISSDSTVLDNQKIGVTCSSSVVDNQVSTPTIVYSAPQIKTTPQVTIDNQPSISQATQINNSTVGAPQTAEIVATTSPLTASPSATKPTNVMTSPTVTSSPSASFNSIASSPSINFGMLTNSPVNFCTSNTNTTPTSNDKTVSYISLLSGNTVHISGIDDNADVQLSNETSEGVNTPPVPQKLTSDVSSDTLNTPPQQHSAQNEPVICSSNVDIHVHDEKPLLNTVTMTSVDNSLEQQEGTVVTQETEYISADQQIIEGNQMEGHVITSPDQIITSSSNIYQTPDGTIIIQNPDGTTFQLQGAQDLPLETVQELLVQAMETAGEIA